MCFSKKYRGYLDEPKDGHQSEYPTHPRAGSNRQFELPPIIATEAIVPHAMTPEDDKKED